MSKFDKEEVGGIISAFLATLFIIIGLGVLGYNIFYEDNISSHVEEMYHRQLVVTLDSILDARFGAGCCKEDIDTDSVTIIKGRFNGFLAPME